MWEVVSERRMEHTKVSSKPHKPQGKGIYGGLCGPMIGGLLSLPQMLKHKVLNIVSKASSSQLALIPSIILSHHDESHPKIFKDGWGIYVSPLDVFQDTAISDELVSEIGGVQSRRTKATEGCRGVKLCFEDVSIKAIVG